MFTCWSSESVSAPTYCRPTCCTACKFREGSDLHGFVFMFEHYLMTTHEDSMIKKLLTAAAVCAALTGGAAHASSTYDFSYTFSDGQEITGSLIGTSTDGGQAVTDTPNLQVPFAGVAFPGGVAPARI